MNTKPANHTKPRHRAGMYTDRLIAYLLVVLWLQTGWDKLADLHAFQAALGRQPLPAWSVKPLTYLVPATELLAGFLLLHHKTRKAGYWISAGLMAAFTAYVALGLSKVLGRLPCACSKIIEHLSWREHLYVNIGFTLLALTGLALSYTAHPKKISK